MAGVISRWLRVARAKTNEGTQKMEMANINALAKQEIEDGKKNLIKASEALASALGEKNKKKKERDAAAQKIDILKEKARQLKDQGNDELLMKVFEEVQKLNADLQRLERELARMEEDCKMLDDSVQDLKNNITTWEQKVKSAANRIKLQESRASIKKMANSINSMSAASTINKLEEMADNKEAEADAHHAMADSGKTLEEEIDASLAKGGKSVDFEAFKNGL